MKILPVIMSGGAGTRLWPASRQAYPKPFMRMGDGESLLEKTLRRATRVAGDNPILTVTGRDYYFITRDEFSRTQLAPSERLKFLLEPMGRNTAPAIAMAALYAQHVLSDDCALLVLAADHLIKDEPAFQQAAAAAAELAQKGHLVTFGVHPTHPETGYGYIRSGSVLEPGYRVAEFVEKPNLETAQAYLQGGDYFWNSGMFCFTPNCLLKNLESHAPELLTAAQHCWIQSNTDTDPIELDKDTFAALPDISVDYAVMEKANDVAMVSATFDWSDVGSWKAMSEMGPTDAAGNQVHGKAVMVDTENTYVQSDSGKLIATVGVENLVIVDTGDAVLVSDRDRSQDVKAVVSNLREAGDEAATYHQTVYRPWGSYTILEDADDCKVKRLVVKPGQVLSLQKHSRRSEHWTVVKGTAKVRIGDEEKLVHHNESVYIPVETLHRLENPGSEDIHLIEVQTGSYFGEDDIERFEDVYGRVS